MQGPAPIPVFRPSKLTDGPEFQGSLVESPANIFYQQVKASRATLNRMQFQWRSVSDNLLVSPIMRVRFQLKITCPIVWTQITAALSLQSRRPPAVTHCEPNIHHVSAKIAHILVGSQLLLASFELISSEHRRFNLAKNQLNLT